MLMTLGLVGRVFDSPAPKGTGAGSPHVHMLTLVL